MKKSEFTVNNQNCVQIVDVHCFPRPVFQIFDDLCSLLHFDTAIKLIEIIDIHLFVGVVYRF